LALLVPAVILTAVGLVLLWPRDAPRGQSADGPTRVEGEIVSVTPAECPPVPEGAPGGAGPCGTVQVRLTSGPQSGTEVTTDIPAGPGAIEVTPGDDVVLLELQDVEGGAGTTYSIMDFQRGSALWWVGLAFALAVIAFGRWRGLTALAGLVLTFAILLLFIVPAILDGRSPVLVAIVGAAAIMLTVLYLTHGFTLTTTVAVVGTLVSLSLTAALSALATTFTHLSGIADETSSYLNITQGDVNMHGLLLAGIVIGSLGVLDDVTVTQSATVAELAGANPTYGFRHLYRSATRIGRAHIASVINTIVLAYAGASLPLMLLFATGGTPVAELLTSELVAQELVRSAVGTIGLICAVPVTTALAALVASPQHRAPAPAPAGPLPAGPSPTGPAPAGTAPTGPAPHDPRPRPPAADPWTAFVDRDRDT
jgi:uncharacterized membrane protein